MVRRCRTDDAVTAIDKATEIMSLGVRISAVLFPLKIGESLLHAPDVQISLHPAYVNPV